MVTLSLLVPPIPFESRRSEVGGDAGSVQRVWESEDVGDEVDQLIQPKGIESQRMMMMMSRTVVHTHSWDCDCVDVVSPIILSRRH